MLMTLCTYFKTITENLRPLSCRREDTWSCLVEHSLEVVPCWPEVSLPCLQQPVCLRCPGNHSDNSNDSVHLQSACCPPDTVHVSPPWILTTHLYGRHDALHFTSKKTGMQRGRVTCPKSHGYEMTKLGFSKQVFLTLSPCSP